MAEKSEVLYSTNPSIDPDIRALAARLRDGGHDRFRTRASGRGEAAVWLEAVKNQATGRWHVMRCRRAGGLTSHEDAIPQAICFFDALHYCAEFELARKNELQETSSAADPVHYSAAAAAADIPLDDGGLPHPADRGTVLTPGLFTAEQEEIAARTKGRALPPALPPAENNEVINAITGLVKKDPVPAKGDFVELSVRRNTDMLSARFKQKELSAPFEAVAANAQQKYNAVHSAITQSYDNVSDIGRYSVLSALGITTTSAGLLAAAGMVEVLPIALVAGILVGSWPGAPFDRKRQEEKPYFRNNLTKAVKNLPAGKEKNMAAEFDASAKAIFILGNVANRQKEIAEGKKSLRSLRKSQQRGFALIDAAAQESGMPDDVRDQLKDSFRAGTFPSSEDLLQTLSERHAALQKALADKLKDIENNTLPRIPPPGP